MSTDRWPSQDPLFSQTYLKQDYKRPETATEKRTRIKKEKRRARAIKNGRKFL